MAMTSRMEAAGRVSDAATLEELRHALNDFSAVAITSDGAAQSALSRVLLVVWQRWSALLSEEEEDQLLRPLLAVPDAALLVTLCRCLSQSRGYPSAEKHAVCLHVTALVGPVLSDRGRLAACLGDEARVTDVVQALGALPDLVLGALGSASWADARDARRFQPSALFRTIARAALLRGPAGQEPPLRRCRAEAVEKLVRIGQAVAVASALLEADGATQEALLADLRVVSVGAVVVRALEASQQRGLCSAELVRVLLPGSRICRPGAWQELAFNRLLLKPTLTAQSLPLVVQHLHACDEALFSRKAATLAAVWADRAFVQGTDGAVHTYVSGALYHMLGLLGPAQLQARGIVVTLVRGMNAYLDSGVPEVRRLGMTVAERFSKRMDPDNAVVFDELKDYAFPYADDAAPAAGADADADADADAVAEAAQRDGLPEAEAEAEVEVDVEVELELEPEEPERAKATDKRKSYSAWSDSDDDSSDDSDKEEDDKEGDSENESGEVESLMPMSNLGDVERLETGGVAMPRYLQDCIDVLSATGDKQDYQTTATVLKGLPRLLALGAHAPPPDVEARGVDLAKLLLHLENRFAMAGFVEARHATLVLLACRLPTHVAPLLCSQVTLESTFLSVRMTALDVLVAAAQKLSAVPKAKALSAQRDDAEADAEAEAVAVADKDRERNRDVARVGTVTKRWGQRSKPLPVPHENRFEKYAPSFFFPLVADLRVGGAPALLEREALLLSRVVFSLGAIVAAAQNTVHVERMGRAVLRLLWWARFNAEPQVRRACLAALAQVLAAVPGFVLAADDEWVADVAEARAWVCDVQTRDADEACRKQAALLAAMLTPRYE